MDKWDWQRMDHNPHEGKHPGVGHYRRHHHHHHRSRNPSFSSALLDAICKSTEDEQGVVAETRSPDKKNTTMLKNSSCKRAARSEREAQGRQRNEDHWMTDGRRRSAEISVFDAEKYFETHAIESLGGLNATARAAEEDSEAEGAACHKQRAFQLLCQSISSAASCSSETSDNTSNWPYSSSDAESLYRPTGKCSAKSARNFVGREEKARKWASCMARGRERPQELQGRSSVKDGHFRSMMPGEPFVPEEHAKSKPSKSKFRKDSKKPKQPISPGSRLASFLNSLFMAGSAKKAKLSSSPSVSESNSYHSSQRKPAASSVCSSSSSVHRSCLSKTSSSRGKTSNGVRRSVTFYPPSIVVDECSRPCGYMENPTAHPNPADPYVSQSADGYKLPWLGEKLQLQLLEKGNQASTAEQIIAKYHKANSLLEAVARELEEEDQDEEDDDDAASCSSSDLFELENLAPSDISMYQKELPVYETTHLATNKAIAKGLIV